MNIAILGFGIVGKGVFGIINNKNTKVLSEIHVKKILVRENKIELYKKEFIEKYPDISSSIFCFDINDIINDEIDLVVECMGGIDPAFEYVKLVLESGKKIVTSNKMLLAEKYSDLLSNYKSELKYEATVGGGIHIFHAIDEIKKVDKIKSFKGIINGTTNYILSKMTNNKALDFNEVLEEAKVLGFAEQDPTNDIDGIDAKYKATLLYNEIFEKKISPKEVLNEGIKNITTKDILNAEKENKIIKLIAYGDIENVFVKPMLIDKTDYLSHVNENLNIIQIESENLGVSSYVGAGAGMFPTAHAVVLDIIDFL